MKARTSRTNWKAAFAAFSAAALAMLMTATLVFAGAGHLTFVEFQQDGVGDVDGLEDAWAVAVSPDGSHLYVASFGDYAVGVFSRNSTTGALTFVEVQKDGVGGVDGLFGATAVTVSPDESHLYAAGQADDAVAVFSIVAAATPTPVPGVSTWGIAILAVIFAGAAGLFTWRRRVRPT